MSVVEQSVDKKILPAKEAAALVGYSSDYVTRLAREQKIFAERKQNQWFVNVDSLKLFALETEAEKRARSEKIREERLRERSAAIVDQEIQNVVSEVATTKYSALGQTCAIVAMCAMGLHLAWFSFESDLDTKAIAHGVSALSEHIASRVVEPIPAFVSQVASFAFVSEGEYEQFDFEEVENDSHSAIQSDPDFQGVVLFEEDVTDERIDEVRKSFSDEVEVEITDGDVGVITPVFSENDGESYRFLLVPVHEAAN